MIHLTLLLKWKILSDATGDAPSGIDAAGGAATPDTEGSDPHPESSPAMLERKNFVRWQETDHFCSAVKHYLETQEQVQDPNLAKFVPQNQEFFTVEPDGLLVRFMASRAKKGSLITQWVVPDSLKPLVLRLCHDDGSAQHPSTAATHAKVLQHMYWRGLGADVRDYVRSCVPCQQTTPQSTARYKQALMPPAHMWQRLHMDYAEVGVLSSQGHRYLLVITEARSGFCWLFPVKTRTAAEAAPLVAKVLFECGTLVEELVSDRAAEFMSALITTLCTFFKVHKIETSAYHPQSNGVVENLNGRAKRALARLCSHHQERWHEYLDAVQFALRNTAREETGLTPFFCVYGREARFPLDALTSENTGSQDLHAEVKHLQENLKIAEEAISEALQRRAERIQARNDQVQRTLHVAVGDYVWIKKPPSSGRASAIEERFTGPWKLVAPYGESGLSFQCQLMGTRIRETTAHVENMKPYHPRPARLDIEGVHALLDPAQLQELDPDQRLCQILDRRADDDGNWSYKWLACDGTTSEWVREKELIELLSTPPWVLDTFHALYELKHQGNMPSYAERHHPREDRSLSKDAALLRYPCGTQVVRQVSDTPSTTDYVWGQVRDFAQSRWRVRYSDGTWEELTSSQVRAAKLLAECVRDRLRRLARQRNEPEPAFDSSPMADLPANVRVTVSPFMPTDFGPLYVGQVLRYRFSSGWSRGVLHRLVSTRRDRGEFTFDVEFPNTRGKKPLEKRIKLRADYYKDDARAMPSSWNLMLARELAEEPLQANIQADLQSASPVIGDTRPLKRSRKS